MSTITVPLSDEDLDSLRAYSATQGISPEAFLARQARNLREHLQKAVHPDVTAAPGIVASEVAAEDAYRRHVERKHQ